MVRLFRDPTQLYKAAFPNQQSWADVAKSGYIVSDMGNYRPETTDFVTIMTLPGYLVALLQAIKLCKATTWGAGAECGINLK